MMPSETPFEAELLFVLVEELLDFLVRGGRHFGFELFLELADEQRLTGFCPKLLFRQPGFLELFPVVLFGQSLIGNLPLDGLVNFGIRDLDLLALGALEQDFFVDEGIKGLELGSGQLDRAEVAQLGIGLLLFEGLLDAPVDFGERNDNGIDFGGNLGGAAGRAVGLVATGEKPGASAGQRQGEDEGC